MASGETYALPANSRGLGKNNSAMEMVKQMVSEMERDMVAEMVKAMAAKMMKDMVV